MTIIEQKAYKFLLVLDLLAILISMAAGPLDNTVLANSAAMGACIISLSLVIYGLYFWRRKEQ